ncbi:cyclophilin-like fold protein [Pediococcus ethanolidurans]|uniref:Cyclophilin-like domain-containing protein n=1 Tax=Pediococcus ethanolidurans TaxID=319653 RepID=A0A0R2JZX7_9LACO|nr:cyclophilin-like fold protein [Pediococcus ethanolidurans]KRN82849.1 hypothetical protein IV87_GL001796 [Pediococcus ethanolidurans]GEN94743.1 hypothetical protein PET01_07930 [Pediococcus ethanolidurans]SER19291.1 hypothetical protein SAMN04487973_102198 [Pediococcus ethanolidurans]
MLIALIILGAKQFTDANKNTSAKHSSSSAQFTEKSSKNNKADLHQQGKAINITIAGQKLSAHLYKNVTAKDLIQRLPITLSFSNFGSGFDEKIGDLPSKLTTQGMPTGEDPKVGDIGYWSPEPRIVFYWGDVGYYSGIHRIGHFDDVPKATQLIKQQKNTFKATIELAN